MLPLYCGNIGALPSTDASPAFETPFGYGVGHSHEIGSEQRIGQNMPEILLTGTIVATAGLGRGDSIPWRKAH